MLLPLAFRGGFGNPFWVWFSATLTWGQSVPSLHIMLQGTAEASKKGSFPATLPLFLLAEVAFFTGPAVDAHQMLASPCLYQQAWEMLALADEH